MTPEELDALVAKAVDGTLTELETAHLLKACREDSAILERLARQVATDRLLHAVERDPKGRFTAREVMLRLEQERVARATTTAFVPAVVAAAKRTPWWSRPIAIAAMLTVFAGIGAFLLRDHWRSNPGYSADGPISERVATAPAVAVLSRAVDVKWKHPAEGPSVGEMLGTRTLELEKGIVQVQLLGGAELLVEGPASLTLKSENSAFLAHGKVRAQVPEPARGFTLQGPDLSVIDLGTAFGASTSTDGKSEVHVFEGEVSVLPGHGLPNRNLKASEGVRMADRALHSIPADASQFPDAASVSRIAASSAQNRLQSWRDSLDRLASDPAMLVCYGFEPEHEWSRTVSNRGPLIPPTSHATLVGAGWTSGRWPGKHAIELRSIADRMRFHVPGVHHTLTLMAWVRVDSLPNDYNSLILPSHYTAGSLHWMLERGGQLRLTMMSSPPALDRPRSFDGPVNGTAITNMDFGRWIFVATTYDAASGVVRHYRDGEPIGVGKFEKRLPAILGDVEFGNWGADGLAGDNAWTRFQAPNHRTRNFVGRVDELTILGRVLSPEEIARHYQAAQP